MNELFRKFSENTSTAVGSPWAFILAVLTLIIWAVTGPIFHYSDTWQLIINTGTTIVTFLMVFLIQNTQNRESRAINLKLDELIKGNAKARNKLVGLEDMEDEELKKIETDLHTVKEARTGRKK